MMKRIIAAIAASGALAAPGAAADDTRTAYDFEFASIDGQPLPLSAYEGKTLLIVNVASKCGFTPHYDQLQALHETYADQGLVVIGAPANQFMNQEPGSEADIKKFCEVNFDKPITFALTSKVAVKGPDAHAFYDWAAAANADARPGWNFHRILIDRSGQVAATWGARAANGETGRAWEIAQIEAALAADQAASADDVGSLDEPGASD